jgi:hypothetical protein
MTAKIFFSKRKTVITSASIFFVASILVVGCTTSNQQEEVAEEPKPSVPIITAETPGGEQTEGVLEHKIQRLGTGTISVPTIYVPRTLTRPTRFSQSVRMGSASRAEDFLCRFMTHYSVALNADFDATLNVFKHRAARMGADWVAITKHSEVVAGIEVMNQQPIYVIDDSSIFDEHSTLTKIEGDIYDCR